MPTPQRTSHTAIITAAREILESDGPAGLTMQAVATRVGVRAPSLYKHVRDREALLSAVTESAIDELGERLASADADLRALAAAYRTHAHAQPEAFRLMFTTSAPLDALQRAAAPVIDAARGLVGDAHALDAARLFTAWATGFLNMELAGAFRLDGGVDAAFHYGLEHLIRGLERES